MVAGEEGRSGQYEGTAMSHDEASKVPQIIAFGNFIDKSIINICSIIKYFYIIEKARHFAVRAFSTVCKLAKASFFHNVCIADISCCEAVFHETEGFISCTFRCISFSLIENQSVRQTPFINNKKVPARG